MSTHNRPMQPQFVRVCDCGCGQPTMVRSYNVTTRGHIAGQPAAYVGPHGPNARVRYEVTPEMWTVEPNGCWRAVNKPGDKGYCEMKIAGVARKAHIAVYEHIVGPVPEGLQLDHLCRNRACVNPDHLEPVTQTENVRRGLRAKLTVSAAAAIRASDEHYTVLMQRYGVSKSTVHKVRAGTAWVIAAAEENAETREPVTA